MKIEQALDILARSRANAQYVDFEAGGEEGDRHVVDGYFTTEELQAIATVAEYREAIIPPNRRQVVADFREFFHRYPDQENPTDLNTVQKWNFATEIGFDRLRAMQAARKQGEDFTKRNAGWQKI